MKRAEAGATAHVAGKAVGVADAVGAREVEEAAAEKQVARGADSRGGFGVAHQAPVVVVEVDAMRVHRTLTHQAEALIHIEIGARLREQLARPRDLVLVFGDVRMNPSVGIFGCQLTRALQLRGSAGGCEAWRDGVAKPVDVVPAPDQCLGIDQALLRMVAHPVGRMAILQHLARDHAQLPALRTLEKSLHRSGMRCREGQCGRDAVAHQFVEKDFSHLGCMRSIGKLAFLGKGVVFKPGQQPIGRRADDVGLRKMDVHVDEPGRQDPAWPVRDSDSGMARCNAGVAARVEHPLAALRVGADHQQAVFIEQRSPGVVESKERGTVGFFHRVTRVRQHRRDATSVCSESATWSSSARKSAPDAFDQPVHAENFWVAQRCASGDHKMACAVVEIGAGMERLKPAG